MGGDFVCDARLRVGISDSCMLRSVQSYSSGMLRSVHTLQDRLAGVLPQATDAAFTKSAEVLARLQER